MPDAVYQVQQVPVCLYGEDRQLLVSRGVWRRGRGASYAARRGSAAADQFL